MEGLIGLDQAHMRRRSSRLASSIPSLFDVYDNYGLDIAKKFRLKCSYFEWSGSFTKGASDDGANAKW